MPGRVYNYTVRAISSTYGTAHSNVSKFIGGTGMFRECAKPYGIGFKQLRVFVLDRPHQPVIPWNKQLYRTALRTSTVRSRISVTLPDFPYLGIW